MRKNGGKASQKVCESVLCVCVFVCVPACLRAFVLLLSIGYGSKQNNNTIGWAFSNTQSGASNRVTVITKGHVCLF